MYHNDFSTIPVAFIVVYKYRYDICRYYERRESQRLQRFDLELDAILISVFINRTTWKRITHVHLCLQNVWGRSVKGKCWLCWIISILIFVHKQIRFYNHFLMLIIIFKLLYTDNNTITIIIILLYTISIGMSSG